MSTALGTDVDQVVAVATEYVTSSYSGSAEERAARIERVLHPLLAKRSPSRLQQDGTFYEWTVPKMIEIAARSVDDPAKRPYSVRVLDLSRNMASVRTDADWGIDYMHLAKIDGGWRVVNVLWCSAPKHPRASTNGASANGTTRRLQHAGSRMRQRSHA